jgi:uncharacterized protein YciI
MGRFKFFIVLSILFTSLQSLSAKDECDSPPGMDCKCVTLVECHAASNWENFGNVVGEHLEFLKANMKTGDILAAGPFYTATGGTFIYNGTDWKKLDELVAKDPAVASKAVTPTYRKWMMCNAVAQ